jgi:exopolysaccharide biosynthesis polyprenyl glycosylphosphotransferase
MHTGRGVLLIALTTSLGLVLLSHCTFEVIWPFAGAWHTCLIIGTGGLARCVESELRSRAYLKVRVAGLFDPGRKSLAKEGRSLTSTVDEEGVSCVVIATEDGCGDILLDELVRVKVKGVTVEDAHATLAALTGHWWLDIVQPSSFVFSSGFKVSRVAMVAKRMVDIGVGTLGLVLCMPLMIVVAIAIKLDSKGPVLYRQRRLGWKGDQFELLKFRSMVDAAEGSQGAQWAAVRDPRITRCGAVLRKYRLDELPQLANIIVGDMSLVGPRPERPEFVALLRQTIRYYDERHEVKPGLTGWAQVKYPYGSCALDAKRKLEYDLFYIERRSLAFDAFILLKTVQIVIAGGVQVSSASLDLAPESRAGSMEQVVAAGVVKDQ